MDRRSGLALERERRAVLRPIRACVVAAAVLGTLLASVASAASTAQDLVIERVTVVSAERQKPLRDVSVSIHDGRIASITRGDSAKSAALSGARIIDGRGLYLAPGLIDGHVHLGEIPGMRSDQEKAHPQIASDARAQIPRSYLYFGYTTVIDLNSSPAAMALWEAQPLRPDTYFCGGAAVMDGYPMQWIPRPERYQLLPYFLIEPGTAPPPGIDPAEHTPAAAVKRMKADGAVCVKTYFERGYSTGQNLSVPAVETIRTVVREARAVGMPVLMHANSAEAQEFALSAGVDIIAHGLWNWPDGSGAKAITPQVRRVLERIAVAQVGWQPTIVVVSGQRDLFESSFLANPQLRHVVPSELLAWYRTGDGQWFHDVIEKDLKIPPSIVGETREKQASEIFSAGVERDQRAVGYLSAHGGRILFGTDTPSAPTYANQPGLNGWLEMHLLVAAGMMPAQVFRAATLANSQALGLHDVGAIKIGRRANLLLLTEDPTRTVEAYDTIVSVILNGKVIDRKELAADRS